jgi:hypothetical protein
MKRKLSGVSSDTTTRQDIGKNQTGLELSSEVLPLHLTRRSVVDANNVMPQRLQAIATRQENV